MTSDNANSTAVRGVLLEGELGLSLVELSRACGTGRHFLIELVAEGVLSPSGENLHAWRFSGPALRRARTASRLTRDLELNVAGVALVLDLLDRIDALDVRLRRVRGA